MLALHLFDFNQPFSFLMPTGKQPGLKVHTSLGKTDKLGNSNYIIEIYMFLCKFPAEISGAPIENIVQNHLNIALLNVF